MENFFPEVLINEIKESNDITDVIGQYIHVKSVGSSYKALCPFHNEKTPSFIINREKQSYKCFGCGEGGDVIRFVMKIENLDFVEATKMLANRANIHLDEQSSKEMKQQSREKKILLEINKVAGRFYYNYLVQNGKDALKYLAKRGLQAKTITSFGLGLAPHDWNRLLTYLKKEGYQEADIEKAGLIIPKKANSGYYDRFRNRIMFPIFDIQGNVIGFGGRVLDDSLPKYLNSPETKVFNKSSTLYGINIARKNVLNQQLILVEGYMDVIALHQQGFKNAVATLGTSLTKYHAQLLKKYCDEVIICFDGDQAGTKATLRSLDILSEVECNARILILPDQLDPDEFIRSQGKVAFTEQIQRSMSLIDYKIFLAKQRHSLSSVEGKVKMAKEIATIVKGIKSPIEQEAYIQKIEDEMGISKNAIQQEIFGKKKNLSTNSNNQKYSSRYKRDNNKYIEAVPFMEQKGHIIVEKQLIKFMLLNPQVISTIAEKIKSEDFSVGKHQSIVEYIFTIDVQNKGIEGIMAEIEDEAYIQDILSVDIEHIDIHSTIEKYLVNIKRYTLIYEVKQLEEQQRQILKDPNLNKEEVENALLKIGMEIMKKNTVIQKLNN